MHCSMQSMKWDTTSFCCLGISIPYLAILDGFSRMCISAIMRLIWTEVLDQFQSQLLLAGRPVVAAWIYPPNMSDVRHWDCLKGLRRLYAVWLSQMFQYVQGILFGSLNLHRVITVKGHWIWHSRWWVHRISSSFPPEITVIFFGFYVGPTQFF